MILRVFMFGLLWDIYETNQRYWVITVAGRMYEVTKTIIGGKAVYSHRWLDNAPPIIWSTAFQEPDIIQALFTEDDLRRVLERQHR